MIDLFRTGGILARMPTVTTAPQLLALAEGESLRLGENHCFYCGAPCDDSFTTNEYLAATSFNDWNIVASPQSKFVCCGCTLALREQMKWPGKEKPQRFRNYSWLLTEARAKHFTKGDQAEIAAVLLTPPEPPWAMALAVSGQRHVLYRTPVNFGGDVHTVQLEADRVHYSCTELSVRLDLVRELVSAIGKPALESRITTGHAMAACERYGDRGIALIEEWISVSTEPLSRLAIFLCPGRDKCNELYAASTDAA